MSFSYREEQRGDQLLDVLTNEETGVRITVARFGAELISLARRRSPNEWLGYLVRDDDLTPPAQGGWGNHATVMGYFLHRLKDGKSLYRGREISGGNHSFLRTKTWHFDGAEVESGRLSYAITRADFTDTDYPLDVSHVLSYQIEGERVRVTFQYHNHEPELSAHLGFGLHPGFAATAGEPLRLDMPAGSYRRWFAPTNYLSGETQLFHFAGGQMPFEREKLPGSFILEFVDVPERTFRFVDLPSGRNLELDFNDVPYVTLWSDGGDFLCVEPCWGLTDHDQQRAFENKEGIHVLAAGRKLERSFTMTPRINI